MHYTKFQKVANPAILKTEKWYGEREAENFRTLHLLNSKQKL